MLNQNYPPKLPSKNPKFTNPNYNYYSKTHRNDPLGVANIYKPRQFHRKKSSGRRYVPYAPRNTTSFLIRAKKSGGIAFPVSPCAATPAVLPTPEFSPAREVVVETAKEEWGVNGYGTMSGLIRLREFGGNGESDLEKLDHEFSRFEMIYPRNNDGDSFLGRVVEGSVSLKERLFSMETQLEDMRRRVLVLEMRCRIGRGNVEEFGSDNEGGCYVYGADH